MSARYYVMPKHIVTRYRDHPERLRCHCGKYIQEGDEVVSTACTRFNRTYHHRQCYEDSIIDI